MRTLASITVLALLSLVVLQGGCAQTSATAQTGPFGAAQGGDYIVDQGGSIARPARVTATRVGAELMPGRIVPYDNMALPLVSPDGRYVATQTRVGPDWPTILAERGAQVPYATRVEIYRIPDDSGAAHDPESEHYGLLDFIAELDQPVLLGRSYDERGFLIEAPQEDGSRWIGFVPWDTGAIDWLVADEHVNAFASLGPEGRLAWSRRAVDVENDGQFELVVRRGSEEWTIGSPPESWLMPTWSWRGDGLFVLSLLEGHLEAVHAIASDPAAFRQSRQRTALATDANIFNAYQTIGAQVAAPMASRGRAVERFIFFHPAMMRMAMWRPRAGGITLFDRLSYAAIVHDESHAIVTTEDWLLWRNVSGGERDRTELLSGMHVPRPTPGNPEWPYMLLTPEDGQVAVVPMRPLTARDLVRQ